MEDNMQAGPSGVQESRIENLEDWLQKHDWLELSDNYVAKKGCRLCKQSIAGYHYAIERHMNTPKHKRAVERQQLTQTPIDVTSTTYRLQRLKELERNQQIFKAKMLAFIAENAISFSIIAKFIKLMLSCNDLIYCMSTVAFPQQRISKYFQNEVPKACNKALENIVNCNKQYISLAIDEATDASKKKILAFVIRCFSNGEVKDHCFGLRELPIRSDSKSIAECVTDFLDYHGISYNQLIGFASDNCPTMVGGNTGVLVQLREKIPQLFSAQCICHRLHLASSYAVKVLPQNINDFLAIVCGFFKMNPARQVRLKTIQEGLSLPTHKMIALSATRWLNRLDAINRVLEQWDALVIYFNSLTNRNRDRTPKSLFVKHYMVPKTKCYLLFLKEILSGPYNANLEFQSAKLKIHTVMEKMTILILGLASNIMNQDYLLALNVAEWRFEGPTVERFKKLYYSNSTIGYLEGALEDSTTKDQTVLEVRDECTKFIRKLCIDLQRRFNWQTPLLKVMKSFYPSEVVNPDANEVDFSQLARYFKDSDMKVVEEEFRILRTYSSVQIYHARPINDFWWDVSQLRNADGQLMFANISRVVMGLLTIPHSTASVERIFATNKLHKTPLRNRISVTTCDTLLKFKELVRNLAGSSDKWTPTEEFLASFRKT